MDQETSRWEAQSSGGATVAAVVFGFLASPLLRYADPRWLEASGAVLAVGLGLLWMKALEGLRGRRVIPFLLFALLGLVMFYVTLSQGSDASLANDNRCGAIQRDMLSHLNRRPDDAAMMQALGCRPQGDQMPAFPPGPKPTPAPTLTPKATRAGATLLPRLPYPTWEQLR